MERATPDSADATNYRNPSFLPLHLDVDLWEYKSNGVTASSRSARTSATVPVHEHARATLAMVVKDIRFPAYLTMFHPNTDKENNGLQDIQTQKKEQSSGEREKNVPTGSVRFNRKRI